jgi:hypothetical protein
VLERYCLVQKFIKELLIPKFICIHPKITIGFKVCHIQAVSLTVFIGILKSILHLILLEAIFRPLLRVLQLFYDGIVDVKGVVKVIFSLFFHQNLDFIHQRVCFNEAFFHLFLIFVDSLRSRGQNVFA